MNLHGAETPADPPYWMARPRTPALKLPQGACDAHVHIFGPRMRFPFADGRRYTPSDATKEMLFALHAKLGIAHCVIVQPACHGYDNTVTADAIAATGRAYRGVGLMPTSISDAELKRLDAAGLCGARFHYMQHLAEGAPIADVVAFGKRLADIGWHLQIHMAGDRIDELAPAIARAPVPVMIDHLGRIDASRGLEQAPFQALLRLMAHGHVWIKVSGVDRITRTGPPYLDALPFARKLVAEFGDRVVWGSDWPHPSHTHVPDDGQLVDLIDEIAPTPAALRALMVDNPMRFYRFAPARRLT
jgi:2-pyrone-4,6-dicarboxylate lactonase